MSSESRWAFFDLGWTLVDETAAHLNRFNRLRRHIPTLRTVSDAQLMAMCEEFASAFAPSPFRALLGGFGQTLETVPFRAASYDHDDEELYSGVAELLDRLRPSFRLGLIANQSAGTLQRLERFGVIRAFSVVVSSAEAGLSKPDARIFEHARTLAGCSPHAATMIGDRLDNDIGPAKRAGWRTVRVLQGFARGQVPRSMEESPDHTVKSIGDLKAEMI